MLDKKMQDALNKQVNEEMFSAYLYLSMSAHFEERNLKGFAAWMKAQAQEEMVHAMKFYNFILERGGEVNLLPLEGPKTSWESVSEAFGDALNHERHITGRINDLYALAEETRDQATRVFLHWFIDEQVEEEATADDMLQTVRMVEKSPGALYQLDRDAGQRQFNLAAATTQAGE